MILKNYFPIHVALVEHVTVVSLLLSGRVSFDPASSDSCWLFVV